MILILASLSCTSAARICLGSMVWCVRTSYPTGRLMATPPLGCVLYGGGCSDDVYAGDECVESGRLFMCPVDLLQDNRSFI